MDFNLKKLSETCRVVVQESDIKKQFYGLKGLSNLKKIGVETVINKNSFNNTSYQNLK